MVMIILLLFLPVEQTSTAKNDIYCFYPYKLLNYMKIAHYTVNIR